MIRRVIQPRMSKLDPALGPFGLPDGTIECAPHGWVAGNRGKRSKNSLARLGGSCILTPLEPDYSLFSGTYADFGASAPGAARSMDVRIKMTVAFTIAGSSLEDALAEYDELTVSGLIREILDKAIACDNIQVEVVEGPNTLEDYDSQAGA